MTLIADHIVVMPVLIPLTGGVLLLLLKGHRSLQARGALVVMSAALVSAGYLLYSVHQNGLPMALQVGGWSAPFGITLMADMLSALFVLMSHLVLVMVVMR